ncbi:homoserine dehydrogenase [Psychrilyobacter atlanticus]|uniref:homoserine dehydrogenase n=1 Tax=Psychrilyobacter atlanticus TaxID=271091 RepID=UPI000428B70E|nr:homoserine dehydrogenase [Psychrilyobacter atlanticus]
MKVGIIGIGTVGREVINIISCQRAKIEKLLGEKIEVQKICNRTPREEYEDYSFTHDYKEILKDPSIDTVIELMGGIKIPLEIAKKTLTAEKNLVTANKELLAIHGNELFQLAKEKDVKIFFEAAVGGGIPILSPLKESLFPNNFKKIRGILNGTANYILTQMSEGASYEQALKDATEKGYAETDPTFDVEGIDSAHKISLLSYLAWGEIKEFKEIKIDGITGLTAKDIEKAAKNNQKYKLLGEAAIDEDTQKITLAVKPILVGKGDLFYEVNGIYNAIEIEGSYTGKTIFYGEGAGGNATANAVISDLYKVINSKSWQR